MTNKKPTPTEDQELTADETPSEVWRMFQDSYYVVPNTTDDGDVVAAVNYDGPCHASIDLNDNPDYQPGPVIEVGPDES